MPVPSVSVVVPAFNRAGSIRAAIDSVLRQTWRDFEIVVVDDGSADGTAEAVEAMGCDRLRLIRHAVNRGAAAARNTGIREARGAWIAFQDSDDEWLPLKLEIQMDRLHAADPDTVAAYCGLMVLDTSKEGRTRARYHPPPGARPVEGALFPAILRQSLVSTQTLVARRDALLAIGGFDESLRALEDWELTIRLAQQGPFVFVDRPLVLQRFSPNSLTWNVELQRAMRMRIVDKHREAYAAHPDLLAHRHYMNAGTLRRQGALAAARASLARACRLQPGNLRYWAMLAYVAPASLFRPGPEEGAAVDRAAGGTGGASPRQIPGQIPGRVPDEAPDHVLDERPGALPGALPDEDEIPEAVSAEIRAEALGGERHRR
jgi:glycosyltransferase involved in cell wall biosynthesis